MRPQTIGVVAACVVTGIFMAAVGLVVAWPIFEQAGQLGLQKGPANGPIMLFAADQPPMREEPVAKADLPKVRGEVVPAKAYDVSPPQTHRNLSIYLIHGKDTMKTGDIVTLQEALAANVATVRDTGVNLTIDNRSNAALFIQAGDIVKGGNQDRTLPYDMLIPAKTEGTTMAALCVEQGRSFPRANEISHSFETATEQLPGRSIRLAANKQAQNEVWDNVRKLQDNLTKNAGGSVRADLSQTSLQLSLEHQRVQAAVQKYLDTLAPTVEGQNDVIGYVAVVNGKVHSADVYGSNALFMKLWPKLIRASAVEALAEREHGVTAKAPSEKTVQALLADAEKGTTSKVEAGPRTTVVRYERNGSLLLDTCDHGNDRAVLHRSLLTK